MQHELVERAKAGDHEAFSILVRRSYPRLHGIASLILRDQDRAQDAVQEALVLAWRHIRAVRDADAWDAWLLPHHRPGLLPAGPDAEAPGPGRAARGARPGVAPAPSTSPARSSTGTCSDASWAGCPSSSGP